MKNFSFSFPTFSTTRLTGQIAYQCFLRTNSYVAEKPPGRPEKLSEKEQRLILRRVEKDPKTTLERVRVPQNSFSTSKTVSKCTIRKILKKYGIVSRKTAKKVHFKQKTKTDQKTLVLENVEHYSVSASLF